MHHFYEPEIANGRLFLNDEESRHALKVMRLMEGDIIEVLDGKGVIYRCRITNARKNCEFLILDQKSVEKSPFSIHIAIAPTKNQDRMEWFAEKATEIGVDKISFIISQNTERNKLRMDRVIKKAVGGMKQSLNLWLPEINEGTGFSDFVRMNASIQNKFIAYVDENHSVHLKDAAPKGENVLILIGPEGDFTKDEIRVAKDLGHVPVSLGANRLRTETAGIVACHTINLINWGS
jgi:16S rRNA (uracil1498-N3)-methyltransferase